MILQAHQHRCCGVPEQCEGEDRAATEAVGELAEQAGAEKQPEKGGRRERGLVGHAKRPLRACGKDPFLDQSRADVGGLEQVVQLKEATDGQQRHEPPDRCHCRQAVDAGRNQRGAHGIPSVGRGSG